MIEDLDGAAVEPTRRRHVAALSGAVAAASFALLLVLIAPPSPEAAVPQNPSPVATASESYTLTIASQPMNNVYVDLTRTSLCPDGTLLAPPYWVGFDATSGQGFAVQPGSTTWQTGPVPVAVDPLAGRPQMWSSAGTSRSVLVTFVYDRQGRYIVTCATSESITPPERLVRD